MTRVDEFGRFVRMSAVADQYVASFRIPHAVVDRIQSDLATGGVTMTANEVLRELVIQEFTKATGQTVDRSTLPSITPAIVKRLTNKAARKAEVEQIRNEMEALRLSIHEKIDQNPPLTFNEVFASIDS